MMIIKDYDRKDETGWVRCRVLAFLDSAYYDNVLRTKETYLHPAIELVAEDNGQIVGLLDAEYETKAGEAGYKTNELTGIIWHLAVLPEYRNQGVATKLFETAVSRLKEKNITLLQAWTRDDKMVNDWYLNRGFVLKESYLHVYAENEECELITDSKIKNLYVCNCFAHYTGKDNEAVRRQFKRVHDCNLYEFKI